MPAPKSLEGLHPTIMRPRVEAILADPQAKAIGLYVVSAFRSVERQRHLWEAALKKYGNAEIADNWVARPGQSNHGPKVDGCGTAVDFGVPGYKAASGQWPTEVESKVNAVCARHGLASPMAWEDWHFEPIPGWKPRPVVTPPRPPAPGPYLFRNTLNGVPVRSFSVRIPTDAVGDGSFPGVCPIEKFMGATGAGVHDKYNGDADSIVAGVGWRDDGGQVRLTVAKGPANAEVYAWVTVAD